MIIMDGVKILLDGVSKSLYPYIGTPDEIVKEIKTDLPDILAFTHMHEDHYDSSFAEYYKNTTKRPVYSPENVSSVETNSVKLEMINTRHIGKSNVPHISFLITGSRNVWFMGDASPLALKEFNNMPKPDVLIAPYSFANTSSGWRAAKETGAEKIIILHLPDKADDEYGIWNAVAETTGDDMHLIIPDIGQTITI